MIQSFGKLLRAEWRLHQHNKVNKLGVVDPSAQTLHFLPNVFEESVLKALFAEIEQIKSSRRIEGFDKSSLVHLA